MIEMTCSVCGEQVTGWGSQEDVLGQHVRDGHAANQQVAPGPQHTSSTGSDTVRVLWGVGLCVLLGVLFMVAVGAMAGGGGGGDAPATENPCARGDRLYDSGNRGAEYRKAVEDCLGPVFGED